MVLPLCAKGTQYEESSKKSTAHCKIASYHYYIFKGVGRECAAKIMNSLLGRIPAQRPHWSASRSLNLHFLFTTLTKEKMQITDMQGKPRIVHDRGSLK